MMLPRGFYTIYVFLIVLLSGGVVSDLAINSIRTITLIFSLFIIMTFVSFQKFRLSFFLLPFIFSLIFVLQNFLWGYQEIYLKYAIFSLLICSSAAFVRFDIFRKDFLNIIFLLSTTSLIILPFSILFQQEIHQLPYISSGTREFYNLFFLMIYKHPTAEIIASRNASIFIEPGMFASLAALALLVNAKESEQLISFKKLVVILAGLSTFSIVMFVFITVYSLMVFNRQLKKLVDLKLFLFFSSVLIALYSLSRRFASSDGSLLQRIESSKIDFSIFLNSPIWGVGFSGYYGIITEFDSEFIFQGSVSPFVNLFAVFGFFLPLMIMFTLIIFLRKLHFSFQEKILAFLILILILGSQPLALSPLFLFLYNASGGISYQKTK